MHQPRPYGLHAIGLPLTERDEAFINSVTKRITNLKEISRVDSMKMVYDLPDGGYVIVQDMGGNFRVISHKPIHGKDPVFDGIETDYIPMLFSGSITKTVVYENEPVGLRLTEQARMRVVNYSHLDTKPSKDLALQRFRIDYNNRFAEFKTRFPSKALRTQYNQQRPTWYSGAMAEVMQIVGGYGRQDFANLPDEKVNKFERAQLLLPKEWLDRVNEELIGLRLPAYTGIPPSDGSFQFDYKFNNTNAVGFDDKKRPWLLKIGPSGVYAMPLPIVPATKTNAFRRYMQLVGDQEVLAILDRFGGMPSGESFPDADSFQAWRRAGVIIKVCGASDFYSHIAYSSACGWSINKSGTEGYNTCYNYKDEAGIGYGLTYKLRLKLVSSDQYFGAEPVELVNKGPIADKVRLYLSQLIPTLGVNGDDKAILYKLRRARSVDIYQRALGRNGDTDRDYWHNLEMSPIAEHGGNITRVYEGYLYHPSPFENQPQIKFPEPLLGGCVSHDFLPINRQLARSEYPNSDTIMFAYYIGDSLKTVKYFIDWASFQQKETGNMEEYMRAGAWWSEYYEGSSSVQGCFYSSDIDDRELIAPRVVRTDIIGKDLGWDKKPYFNFDGVGMMCGTMIRMRYYTHETTTISNGYRTLSLAVCVPYLCRNGLISAKKNYTDNGSKEKTLRLHWVVDPNSYRFWTFDPVFANFNMTIKNPSGSPYPERGNPVWVEEYNYNPSPQSDFADNGDWVGGLPANYTWLIHPDNNVWEYGGGGSMPQVQETKEEVFLDSRETGSIGFSMSITNGVVNKSIPDSQYYTGSPSLITKNVFYKDAAAVVFGEAKYCNVSEPNNKSARATWGYSRVADNSSAHHFIGVINE